MRFFLHTVYKTLAFMHGAGHATRVLTRLTRFAFAHAQAIDFPRTIILRMPA